MFYFAGPITLSFQLNSDSGPIIPDSVHVDVYDGQTIISAGTPVLYSGTTYTYDITVDDADIQPSYFKEYSFLITASYQGEALLANGFFLVHVSDFATLDTTEVYLSTANSTVIMPCLEISAAACAAEPPVKPHVADITLYKVGDRGCNCVTVK